MGINSPVDLLQSTIPVFKPVRGINSQGFWLLPVGEWLLAATTGGGVYSIIKDSAYNVDSEHESAFVLARSPSDSNRVYVGLKNGVEVLQLKDKRWIGTGRVKGVNEEIRTIVEE
jgi:hypothetical protein